METERIIIETSGDPPKPVIKIPKSNLMSVDRNSNEINSREIVENPQII